MRRVLSTTVVLVVLVLALLLSACGGSSGSSAAEPAGVAGTVNACFTGNELVVMDVTGEGSVDQYIKSEPFTTDGTVTCQFDVSQQYETGADALGFCSVQLVKVGESFNDDTAPLWMAELVDGQTSYSGPIVVPGGSPLSGATYQALVMCAGMDGTLTLTQE